MDIAITVEPVSSSVELLIGDNRGNRIVLQYRTWKALIERCMDIERFAQSTEVPPLTIHEFNNSLNSAKEVLSY